ncbi:hypothetical protein D3C76_165640 [compost metagenome]
MELLSAKKGTKAGNVDNMFDAFRGMMRAEVVTNKIEIKGYIYTLSNPVENIWFVHGYTTEGEQVAVAKFDQFDL